MAASCSITLGLAVHEGFPFSPNHVSPRESVLSVSLARSPPRVHNLPGPLKRYIKWQTCLVALYYGVNTVSRFARVISNRAIFLTFHHRPVNSDRTTTPDPIFSPRARTNRDRPTDRPTDSPIDTPLLVPRQPSQGWLDTPRREDLYTNKIYFTVYFITGRNTQFSLAYPSCAFTVFNLGNFHQCHITILGTNKLLLTCSCTVLRSTASHPSSMRFYTILAYYSGITNDYITIVHPIL